MGVSAAPSLCRLVLISMEVRAITSEAWGNFLREYPGVTLQGVRYVDDARLWLWHPRGFPARGYLERITSFIWGSSVPWKLDACNPLIGHVTTVKNGAIRWSPETKAVRIDGQLRVSAHGRPFSTMQFFLTYASMHVQLSQITAGWVRVCRQSSDWAMASRSCVVLARSLACAHGWPGEVFIGSLEKWLRKNDRPDKEELLRVTALACAPSSRAPGWSFAHLPRGPLVSSWPEVPLSLYCDPFVEWSV